MPRRQEEAVRVGIRILVAAALAGLVALLLHGPARAADPLEEAMLESLLETPAVSAEQRLREAEERLHLDRRHRWEAALRLVLDAAWTAGQGGSVRAALAGARDLYRAWEALRTRSPVEREVLRVLDAEMRGGTRHESLRVLHEDLLERERSSRFRERMDAIRDALDSGRLARARRRLDVLLERGFHSELASLEAVLIERESRLDARRRALVEPGEPTRPWEPRLLSALLLGDTTSVCGHPAARDEAALVCAAALHSRGERRRAFDLLDAIADGSGPEAAAAARWLGQSRLHPRRAWARALWRYRIRRVLGWVGGSKLERDGLSLTSRARRAWRSVVSPLNLALSFPMRVIRWREPEGTGVRRAAALVLDWSPEGDATREAREWLARTRPSTAERRRAALFDDGMLRLPPARTSYTPVFARPVLLTASLLDAAPGPGVRRIAERFDGVPAVLLVPASPVAAPGPSEVELSTPEAVVVLRELARAVERGAARSFERGAGSPVEALRRLELGIRGGRRLRVRASGAAPAEGVSTDTVLGLLDGAPTAVAGVALRRGDDDVRVERRVLGGRVPCPDGVVCLDRERPIAGRVYAHVDLDGDTRIGVETRIRRASFRLEMSESGPGASFRLPVAAMLGIERWIPLEASLALDLTGVRIEPKIRSDVATR